MQKLIIILIIVFITTNINAQKVTKSLIIKGIPFSTNSYVSLEEDNIDKMNKSKNNFFVYSDTTFALNKINDLQKCLKKIVNKGVKIKTDYDLRLGLFFLKNGKILEKYYIDKYQKIIHNGIVIQMDSNDIKLVFSKICKPLMIDSLSNEKKYWVNSPNCR